MMKKHFMLLSLLLALTSAVIAQPCGAPTNLTLTFDATGYTFSWSAVPNATSYIWQGVDTGVDWAYAYNETVTTNSVFLPAQGAGTFSIEWRVIAVCPGGQTMSAVASFDACAEPVAPTTINITSTSAQFNWTEPGAVLRYAVGYRPLGSGSWIALGQTTATTFTLNNLTPNTAYEWCVNKVCNTIGTVSDPVITQFTTLPAPCGTPTTLNVLNLTSTSARLNWVSVNGATGFAVQHRLLGAANWTTVNSNSSTQYQLNGLTPNTAYQYRVAAVCSGVQGVFAAPFSFTTNCVALNNSAEWIDFVSITSVGLYRASGAEANGYILWGDPKNLVRGTTYQIRVSAGFAATVYHQDYAAYLDVNRNGTFETSERVSGLGLLNNGSVRQFSLTVPAGAQAGSSVLRVVMLRKNQPGVSAVPCVPAGSFGEMEDYMVNIVASAAEPSAERSSEDHTPTGKTMLYPNPAIGAFTIQSDVPLKQYSVINQQGATMVAEKLSGADVHTIEVHNNRLVSGLYVVKTTDVDGNTNFNKMMILAGAQ